MATPSTHTTAMALPSTTDCSARLRERGLQVTAQRVAVLQAVAAHAHVTADSVVDAVKRSIGTISRQAVYDALSALVERGLVRRIQAGGAPARYEARVGDNHHHLICRDCDRVVDIDCAVGATPCLTAADDAGFVIEEAEVVYWGRCPDCRSAQASAEASIPGQVPQPTGHHT